MQKTKLWTMNFLIDSMTNLFIYLAYYLLMVTIAVYATDNLQASPSEAGLASGIFIVGALFARIFAGRSIEQVGRKKMLYFGLAFFLITTLLYFKITSLQFLFVIRFLHGVGFGIASTATGTVIASIIPNERRGEGTSYYAMSVTLASAVGPFLGMFLNQQGSFSMMLVLVVILLAVSLITVFFLRVPEVSLTKEQLDEMKRFALNNFFEAKAIPISIISVFVGLGFSSILSFLTSYTREINLIDAGSFFFIVYAAAILFSRPVTGRWFDQKGENFVMYPAFLLFAVGLIILSQAQQGLALLLAGGIIGLGYGTFLSSAQAITVKVSPRHRMGLATSTFFSFIDLGIGVGPFFLGFMIPVTGFRGLYACAAIVVFACTILYYFLHGRKAAEYGEPPAAEG
ncbi:Staphylopine export protein [Sporomusa silvacetica DSM 10669]|uniref:Staphylopine export protein n=1 Tax=Sporomusa silvacetica DSM 10669 TaxID=1123289 RepID=A0ABZ3IHT3_9FIRM|nr:MFS transporter [Sporomusa silvacetica]OZC16778.1 multidrug resistance protein MdtL [Sporomusa silvacetica DSM 10669]